MISTKTLLEDFFSEMQKVTIVKHILKFKKSHSIYFAFTFFQNFFSILTSIEERLKSLDNIYSMQLSQTLEAKLDQYSRRLEALDTKIIRLEALVMLNLDKISENISTKNFKDDMSRTNLLRKMDSVYEGINHRLSYMDRKYETNLVKIQVSFF